MRSTGRLTGGRCRPRHFGGSWASAWLGLARRLRDEDAGYTTETIVVTALLVALAIAVLATIAAKVRAKASAINP
jgi:hypothetical protein